ncbi:pyrroloquinoline quinone biosynthesis protein B [Pseudoduganella namucuonensis]|uniref:Coenzyme PQQ synthesis protein B n=2 Tax=Pseudoduganella namucuonensis TaxID=1035707 RepID=A0A1I7EUE6_9BURK|nr:pyrroloquinoline quinone biosynthesis protein B [Pseudoduganella namucuonensis]
MKIIVLGSAAGGGYPQWNCNCHNCDGLRKGTIRSRARTQSSIAISANGSDWLLVNASPDILTQIRATPALQPARAARDSGIAAVLLMDAQVDHVTGLMMLREGKRIPLYCSAAVRQDLRHGFPLARVLSHYCGVQWNELPVDGGDHASFFVPQLDGIRFTAVPLDSKAPPYSPHRDRPVAGDNIGLLAHDLITGKKLFYAPGLGGIAPMTAAAMREADCLLVDGTFWTEDEMIAQGFSSKPAAAMGHLPQSGAGGMIEALDGMPASRKVLIHINNTNPILDEDSPQHATLRRHGIEVAYDGMEILL